MIKIFSSLHEWQAFRKTDYFNNKTLGLVPTMGDLHAGHRSLLARSVRENDLTVLSIFVNPTQFDDPNDLNNYPRALDNDLDVAKESKVDFVLIPSDSEIYPDQYRYQVCEMDLSKKLCGQHRPGHFNGVLTIVLKLLLLAKANQAYFGEKDFQQLQLVKDMTKAFFIGTQIIACPTIRNEHGLALSSRNKLLTVEQHDLAYHFPKLLGSNDTIEEIAKKLTQLGFIVDYIEEHFNRRFGAVQLGRVRLIDNILLSSSII